MESFRIVDEAFVAHAFNGEGARRAGGRWNNPGIPLVYTSRHRSLAILEILVHAEDPAALTQFWHLIPIAIDDAAVRHAPDLPANFTQDEALPKLRAIGDQWANGMGSVGLLVPSVIVPEEFNLLLNPLHPDFRAAVTVARAGPLNLDPRLLDRR